MKSKLSFYSKFCIIALKTHYYALHPYYFKSPHVKTVNLEKPLETSRVSFALRHGSKEVGPLHLFRKRWNWRKIEYNM